MLRILIPCLFLTLALNHFAVGQIASTAPSVIDAMQSAALSGQPDSVAAFFADTLTMAHVMGKRFSEELASGQFATRVARGQGPDRKFELLDRVSDGPFVFDHYRISGPDFSTTTMFMYEVEDGKIVNMWHFDPPSVAKSMTTPTD